MGTRGLVLYLLSGFSVAVLSVLFFSDVNDYKLYQNNLSSSNSTLLHSSAYGSSTDTTWPELEFSWKLVLATVIGFLGSACGTVGGVGGGGIFVPMLTLIVGFDTKSAAALSKCMIMGASASSVWYNLRVPHPTKEVPIIDYDLALLFQPMLMLGITIGVSLSVVFPYWLITVLIIILFMGTSSRSFFKALEMWKEETILKNDVEVCSAWYWVLFCLQLPIALVVFGYESVKLYKEHKKRMSTGNTQSICEASIGWTAMHIAFCSLSGILGGTVGGLLGSGGGFILGPLLLEIGVIPQV
uniref:Sulfite exporter TauE/SafE family protein n=1 Tax=Fagus sylvatica TaxID=28930 RepID=A0A2N9FLL1_FAGSY